MGEVGKFIILESNKAIPYTSNVFLHSKGNKSANYEKLFTWGTEMRKIFQNMHTNILNMSEKIQEIYQYIHVDTYPLVKKCIEVMANYANECYQFAYENKNRFNIDMIRMWQQRETDFINKFNQMHNTILKFSPKQVQFLPNQPLVPVTEYIPPAITIVNPQTVSNSFKNTQRSPLAQNPVASATPPSAPIFVAPQQANIVSQRVDQTSQNLRPYVVDTNSAFTRQEVSRQIPIATEASMDKHEFASQHQKVIQPEMKNITPDIQAVQPQAYPDKSIAIQENTRISTRPNQNEYTPYPVVHRPDFNPQSFIPTPTPTPTPTPIPTPIPTPLNYTSFSLPKPPPPPPMNAYYINRVQQNKNNNISPVPIQHANPFNNRKLKLSGGGVKIDNNNIGVKIQLQKAFYAITQNQDFAKTQFHK